jgi:low temperature requirement protein LtrA
MTFSKFTPPRLRTLEQEGKRTATWLELFYDLAFVVAVAVLADRLLADLGNTTAYFGYFALLWWLWVSHTYYADRYDTDDVVYRLLAAAQMIAIVVIAASLTGTTSSTTAFALGYAFARWVLILMYARAYRHVEETRQLVRGYLIGFGSAAVVWTASAAVPEDARVVMWSIALVIDLATPWVLRRAQARAPLDLSHLPERFGLFTILVLGEAISAVVIGLSHGPWSAVPVLSAGLAIGIAAAVWWIYFDNVSGDVVRRSPTITRTWRPTAWIYSHLPLATSLAALGVALELAILDAHLDSMPHDHRWFLVGSTAVALLCMAVIQFSSLAAGPSPGGRDIAVNRLAGVPFLVLIGLLGSASAVWVMIAVLGVCVAEVVADFSAGERDSMAFEVNTDD